MYKLPNAPASRGLPHVEKLKGISRSHKGQATSKMASKAPPPARVTAETMKRATEMLTLIDALPPSEEKDAIVESEQYAEWLYIRDTCLLKKYTHKPTQEEKVSGVTKDANGNTVKLWKKGIWCHHCKCSAQEWKRHRKTKKCQQNRAKTLPHLKQIENRKGWKVALNEEEKSDRSAPNLKMWMEDLQAEREGMAAEDRKPKKKRKLIKHPKGTFKKQKQSGN